MKRVTAAAVMLCLLATPAFAQMGGAKHGGQGETKKAEHKGPVVDEKAYKAALEKIPDSKVKVDPWGQMRPSPPPKKPN